MNLLAYSGAFVPLVKRPPRPSDTAVDATGASPPTVQTVPTLTYLISDDL